MRANEHQVSGSHYKNAAGIQHWDLSLKLNLPYLESCSTKYVTRWRKKDGLRDLQKSLHYLNKLEEFRFDNPHTLPKRIQQELPYIRAQVAEMARANDLNDIERAYIERLCVWTELEELAAARELLFLLMDEAEARATEGAKPVPLTEENKHADRYGGA